LHNENVVFLGTPILPTPPIPPNLVLNTDFTDTADTTEFGLNTDLTDTADTTEGFLDST